MLNLFRLFVTLAFFGVAAVQDFKTQTIQNRLWLCIVAVGTPLTFLSIYPYPFGVTFAMCSFALILWLFRAWGGADAKALITLSLVCPTGFFGELPYFPLAALGVGALFANIQTVKALREKENIKKMKIPLVFYWFLGLITLLAFEFFYLL